MKAIAISNKLAVTVLTLMFCITSPAYAEDTVIIDLQKEVSQRAEELGKKLEAFHDSRSEF